MNIAKEIYRKQMTNLVDLMFSEHDVLNSLNLSVDGYEDNHSQYHEPILLNTIKSKEELIDIICNIEGVYHAKLWVDENTSVTYATTVDFVFKLEDVSERDGWSTYLDDARDLYKEILRYLHDVEPNSVPHELFNTYLNNLERFARGIRSGTGGMVCLFCFNDGIWINPYTGFSEELQKKIMSFYINVNN